MSETDDTDALLLIPPDLFLEESDAEPLDLTPHRNYVKTLFRKADCLQTRLKHLEDVSLSDSNLTLGESLPPLNRRSSNFFSTPKRVPKPLGKFYTPPRPKPTNDPDFRTSRTFNAYRNTKTSSRKLKLPHLTLKDNISVSDFEALSYVDSCSGSDSSIMDSDCSSLTNSPHKHIDQMILGEIDTFLSNIGRVESYNAVRDSSFLSSRNIDDILSRYINLADPTADRVNLQIEVNDTAKRDTYKVGELKSSVPDLGTGMRDIMFNDYHSKSLQSKLDADPVPYAKVPYERNTKVCDVSNVVVEEPKIFPVKVNSNNLETTSIRSEIVENNNFIEKNCSNGFMPLVNEKPIYVDRDSIKHFDYSMKSVGDKQRDNVSSHSECRSLLPNRTESVGSERTLISLSKLWNNTGESRGETVDRVDLQKFEEEKLRRQHCEDVISQLQKRLLEQQQKLAIAVQIDSSKDEAISKLKNSCVDMSQELSNIEQKHSTEISNLQSQLKVSLHNNNDIKKKMKEDEEEIVKYMTLIQEYENKFTLIVDNFEHEKGELRKLIDDSKCIISERDDRITELKESSELINRLNKQLSESYNSAVDNLEKVKIEFTKREEQFVAVQEVNVSLENELSILKNDKKDLLSRITEEKNRNTHLDIQKENLQDALNVANKKNKTLSNDFDHFKTTSEVQKSELKTYYQKQMENIITNKVTEFQNQLDLAKNLMSNEIQAKEKEIALQFARHLQKVEDRHQLEINILEEKHKEELKFHRVQLSQSKQVIQQLQDKLSSYKNKRTEIASQLHSVMENQWQQALKIITNDVIDSSVTHAELERKTDNTQYREMSKKSAEKEQKASEVQDHIGGKECRESRNPSKSDNKIKLTDEQLQHYVKLLLQKVPGIPDIQEANDNPTGSNDRNLADFEYPTSDRGFENADKKTDKRSHMKPPWK